MATANLLQTSVSGGVQNALALQGDGVFLPKASTTSRLALALGTADKGFLVYDTTDSNIYFWNGTAWESVPSSGDAGANGAVQYNDAGIVSGASNFTYDKVTSAVSIAGALTVDTSTLVVDATNNRVGIGTATPSQALHVRGNILTGSAAGTDSYVNVATDGLQNSYFGFNNSGSTNASGASNNHQYIGNGNAYPIQIVTNGVSIATFSTAAVTITAQNLVMATSGTGIDFSATSSGSGTMTSELLADYEEGTFTPTMLGTTNAGLGTYGSQVGFYTKIGNLVTVSVYLDWTAHTATGNMRLGGLPFATNATANSISSVTFGYVTNIALTALNLLTGYTSSGNTFIELYQTPTGGGASTAVPVDTAAGVGYTVTYRV